MWIIDTNQNWQGIADYQQVKHLIFATKTFGFMKISSYFVNHKTIAYAGELHFNFCGHCGSDTGYFSDSLAHIPQETLTPKPRYNPGLFFVNT